MHLMGGKNKKSDGPRENPMSKNHSNAQIYPTSTICVQRYVDFLMSTLLHRGTLLDGAHD